MNVATWRVASRSSSASTPGWSASIPSPAVIARAIITEWLVSGVLKIRAEPEARRTHMPKPDARKEQQFCSRCHAWGPADAMQPLYRSKDAEAGPWLWMHHHCAEI